MLSDRDAADDGVLVRSTNIVGPSRLYMAVQETIPGIQPDPNASEAIHTVGTAS